MNKTKIISILLLVLIALTGCKTEEVALELKGTQWKVSDKSQELFIDFTRGNKIVTWIRPSGYDCFMLAGGTNLRYEQTADSLRFQVKDPESGVVKMIRLSYEPADGKIRFIDAGTDLKYFVRKTDLDGVFKLQDPNRSEDVLLTRVDFKEQSFVVCELTWEEYVKEQMNQLLEKHKSKEK